MFAAWGRFVARHKRSVLFASLLVLVASGVLLARGGTLVTYEVPEGSEMAATAELIGQQLPSSTEVSAILLLSHPERDWQSGDFYAAAERTIAPLRADERISRVTTPWEMPSAQQAAFVSEDGRRVVVLLTMRDDIVEASNAWLEIRSQIPQTSLEVHATDEVAIYGELNAILEDDLIRAEVVSLPLTLILLLVVFGTVVAALLPLGVGILAVVGGVGGVMLASTWIDMSVYALNIVSLIGLGVAIDYSLFMVARFREELRVDGDVDAAIARTVATAGRAVTFSGLTVAVGISGLAFFKGLYFATLGIAGAIVVTLALVYGLTFLTALLAILGHRVDKWPLPRAFARGRQTAGGDPFWDRWARGVMRRPVVALLPALVVLILVGVPFFGIHLASVGVQALPADAESREGLDILQDEFPAFGSNTFPVVLDFGADPLTREHVGQIYDFAARVRATDGVVSIQSIVDLDPSLSRSDYQDLLTTPREEMPPDVRAAVDRGVGESIVVLRVSTDEPIESTAARDLVASIRTASEPQDARVLVGGATAMDADIIDIILDRAPYALAFIIGVTYLLLLVQTGSVVLPLKALVMNLLSISASFGALVWIFQEGNLSGLLGFTPAPIDPSVPVLLFCIVFGLSMDYEVLLLSRMHEEYELTGDNTQAVAGGLAKSGRLITGAAAIMVVVFGAFATADVTVMKAIGLGLAIAIAVDATIVRAVVVPSAMRLMGKWNWWAPRWVSRLWKAFG